MYVCISDVCMYVSECTMNTYIYTLGTLTQ